MASQKQLEDIIHEVNRVNKSLLDDLLTLKEDKKLTNTQLNSALAEKEKLLLKYEKSKKELDVHKQKTEESQSILSDYESDAARLKAECQRLKDDLASRNSALDEGNVKLAALQSQNTQLLEDKQKIEDTIRNINDKDRNIDSLNAQIKELSAKQLIIDKQRQDDNKKRVEAESYTCGLEKRVEELEDLMTKREGDSKDLKARTKELQEKGETIAKLEAQVTALKANVEQLNEQLATAAQDKTTMAEELSVFQTMLEREQNNRQKVEDDTVTMRSQRIVWENELKTEKLKVADLDRIVERHRQDYQLLKEKLDNVQLELASENEQNKYPKASFGVCAINNQSINKHYTG
ncbi:hypothetical protein SAMD00019534_071620 [Acytostelium subglobosum LB1]|uniref:hypothetical protein n=1 Tax=Acytostelium subglobosum LB1 TaxID=1410327 RepID=UPI0006449BE0|nr:hypothetical protein SAMD00019534_071620 [Acytostelium subglobosum LB1]GAM23987.1 hypothetical protein SAMD00019534_071620 [Acytostelium subglobosum LB1]|eukprot:XP_012753023.1 hypothetical protein SAMD00019534_071620 [Acytostelium subglobosum LB1]